ncbi:tyrosine-type recombinase/integrase [Streptomyces xiamenensis]|uniref:tyrosine-type recombinase/integrase n=1 Tax=Streptomyces xiamenensis TaxID=408015 RepID=UPI0035E054CA
MAGYIEDRWLKKRPSLETGQRERTTLYGVGKRYKVTGIPGVRAKSFERIGDAKAWKAKAEHEQGQGEFIDPRHGAIRLDQYIAEHWLPARYGDPATARTVRSRINHIIELLGAQPLNSIKVPQLRPFVVALEKRLSPGTLHEVWGYLSAIFQAAVEDERIRRNPCKAKTVKLPPIPPRKVRPWSREQVMAVRSGMPERYRAAVDVAVGAGLRKSELFGLAMEDIDWDEHVIHVRRQVKKLGAQLAFALPKCQKTRSVPVPPALLESLRSHCEEFPPAKITLPWGDTADPTTEREAEERAPQTFELIFTSSWGCAIRSDSWDRRAWKPALVTAGLIPPPEFTKRGKHTEPKFARAPENGTHVLRHTFASVQLDAGEPIVAVSQWLGHADSSITLKVYAHMMPEANGRGRAAMQAWFARP